MVPDVASRIGSCLTALRTVVLPSLPSDDAIAHEQTHLVIRHLELLATQVPWTTHYQLAELVDAVGLLDALRAERGPAPAEVNDELAAALTLAAGLDGLSLPAEEDVAAASRTVTAAATALLTELIAAGDQTRVAQIVADFARRDLARIRSWTAAVGIDPLWGVTPQVGGPPPIGVALGPSSAIEP